jgi:DNA anti-recombination protein RmuC
MFENNIFDEYLEEETKRVLGKLKGNKVLTQDDKLIMILKSQTNHFHHLDVELREDIKELREDTDKNNKEIREDIKEVRRDMDKNNKELRQDMENENQKLREDMNNGNKKLREDMNKNNKELRQEFREDIKVLREDMDKGFKMMMLRTDRFMIWSLGLTISSMIFIINFLK